MLHRFFDSTDIEEILDNIKKVLESKRLVLGPFTKTLEENFAIYIGTKYGIAVSSATAALDIVLRFCDVKNSEVIVPTNTFIACPNTVLYAGGKPVFADMNPNSFCLDVEDVKRKITDKTKAIMAVHLSGLPDPELEYLQDLCKSKNIFLIEDCSHSHGGTFHDKKVGTFGIAGCFSFFATKIIPAGTGGIITTNNPDLKEFAEALRHQGGMGGEGQIEVFDKFGYDWMMNEVTATLAINQINKLETQIKKRVLLAKQYENELINISRIRTLPNFNNIRNVYWKFITILDENLDRDKIRLDLRKNYKIDAGILYPTLCHLQPIYKELGHKEGECPIAEELIKHQLTLPINPYMTSDDVSFVVRSLDEVIKK